MIIGGGFRTFIFGGADECLMRGTLACFLSMPCAEEDLLRFQNVYFWKSVCFWIIYKLAWSLFCVASSYPVDTKPSVVFQQVAPAKPCSSSTLYSPLTLSNVLPLSVKKKKKRWTVLLYDVYLVSNLFLQGGDWWNGPNHQNHPCLETASHFNTWTFSPLCGFSSLVNSCFYRSCLHHSSHWLV